MKTLFIICLAICCLTANGQTYKAAGVPSDLWTTTNQLAKLNKQWSAAYEKQKAMDEAVSLSRRVNGENHATTASYVSKRHDAAKQMESLEKERAKLRLKEIEIREKIKATKAATQKVE